MYRLNPLCMYEQDFKQDVGVVSLAIHARLGSQEVLARGTG